MERRISIFFVAAFFSILSVGLAQGQTKGHGMMHHGEGQAHGCGPQQQAGGKMGRMTGGGMMHGMGRGPMGMGACSGGIHEVMAPFHAWMGRLMKQSKAIGLSDKQMDQIGQAVAEHTKSAIRNRAETRVLRVDLMNLLRNESLDLKSVNVLLKKRAELDVQLQMEGIDIYTKVLQMLDEKQRAMAKDMIGTPFSAPWNEMSMGCGMMMRGGAPSGG
jgi:hypothetical protein